MHTFTRPYYQQSNNNNNKIGQTDYSYGWVALFYPNVSTTDAFSRKTGAKIRQSFKTTKLFAVFFHSTLRFLPIHPKLHDFFAQNMHIFAKSCYLCNVKSDVPSDWHN